MPTIPIDIPLVGGVREDVARELLPSGVLRSVENYRVAKPGSLVPRLGYSNPSASPIYQAPSAYSGATRVNRLFEYQGQQLAYATENVRSSDAQGDDYGLFLKQDPQSNWKTCSMLSDNRVAEISSAPLPLYRVRTMTDPRNMSVATVGGYTLICWINNTTSKVAYELRDSDGGVFQRDDALQDASEATCLAVGSRLLMFYRAGNVIQRRQFIPGTSTGLSGATNVITNASNTDPGWDVTADSTSGSYIFAANLTTAFIYVAAFSETHSALGSDSIPGNADRGVACARYGTAGSVVLAGDAGTTSLSAVMYNGEVGSGTRTATVVLDSSFSSSAGPFTCSASAYGYWAAWTSTTTPTGYSTSYSIVYACSLDPTGPSKGTTRTHPNAVVASKPREDQMWVLRSTTIDNNQLLLFGFWGSDAITYRRLIAHTSYRVAGTGRNVSTGHPLSHICPDGSGNRLVAWSEIYNGPTDFDAATTQQGVTVWRYAMVAPKRLASTELGGLHIVGGRHSAWDGAHLVDAPPFPPEAKSWWLSSAGSGSLNGTAYYRICHVVVDAAGNVWRSAPSDTISIGSLSSSVVTVRVAGTGVLGLSAEVYRQHTDGSYRRLGVVAISATATSADFTDNGSISLAAQPLLYTEGGEPEAYPTPPSDVCATWNRRLFVGSGDRLYYSHAYDFGQGRNLAPWMVETFYVQFEDTITGLCPLDSSLLVFTASTIHAITGDGPNRIGQNSYQNPQRISAEVGCSDWRSIVEFRDGVAFRSARGFELIPRGSYSVQPFGDPVEDTSADYSETTSALAQPGIDQIRWTVRSSTDGRVIAYDYLAQLWTVETAPAYDTAIMFGSAYTVASASAALSNAASAGGAWSQASQYVDDDGDGTTTSYTRSLETGDIRGSGAIGWQRVQRVNLLGRFKAEATLQVAAAMDGSNDFDDYEAVTHYGLTDILTDNYTLTGATFDETTGVLTESVGSGGHYLQSGTLFAVDATKEYVLRVRLSDIDADRVFDMHHGLTTKFLIDANWEYTFLPGGFGTARDAQVTPRPDGSYLLEYWFLPFGVSSYVALQAWDGNSSYVGDGRDVFTIHEAFFGRADAHETDAPLRQEFAPEIQKCEALRVRIRDTSATEGAELTALRLDVKPKRKAGRIAPAYRT